DLLKKISQELKSVSDFDTMPDCGYFGEFQSILPSPTMNGYRNKCEFSIGYDHNRQPMVGFRLSRYKDGNTEIASPQNCLHVPEMTKRIVSEFQQFILHSKFPPYDVTNRTGVWSMLTVRQFLMDTMVIVTIYQRGDLSDEEVDSIKNSLVDFFT